MKKYFLCLMLLTLLSGCGMMFKNSPTPTKVENNSKSNIKILDHNKNIIEKVKPEETITVYRKKSISIVAENGSQCKVKRSFNAGVAAGDVLASLFIPFWPVTVPLIWITEIGGGYLMDNISYVDTSVCLNN